MAETEKLAQLNKKINELKKKILLAEGQKKANTEEWEKQKRLNLETISTLKKDVKDLTAKLTFLKNPNSRKLLKQPQEVIRKVEYPLGAKNAEDALTIMDLKVIETKKQLDLLRDKYLQRQRFFNKLVEEYKELLTYKNYQNIDLGGPPPETLEEDANRKLVCHLENEIHRTNVQWMEAEHIRKKYRSIKASLMNDSERFERSLRELEESLIEQQAEINRLQQINKEAVEMRDAAKIILQRQEQQANTSSKAREKQAIDFRRQVEERKLELERIERKLFSSGKTLVHQESIGSSSGEPHTGKTELEDDPNAQLKSMTNDMEVIFKKLMEVTGATNAQEVLSRFLSQKESASRLSYLRTAAEAEKKHLEVQRELLTSELEASKFSDMRENEINQEQVEKFKTEINDLTEDEIQNLEAAEKTQKIIKSITEALIEMIFKLQEVDENDIYLSQTNKTIPALDLPTYLQNDITDDDLICILEEKLKTTLKATAQIDIAEDVGKDDDEIKIDEIYVPLASPRAPPSIIEEKPQPLPICYINLISGRAGQTSSASPGQTPQPVTTDDESEVPSRNFLKKQALLIVDSKSRRKVFRPTIPRRK